MTLSIITLSAFSAIILKKHNLQKDFCIKRYCTKIFWRKRFGVLKSWSALEANVPDINWKENLRVDLSKGDNRKYYLGFPVELTLSLNLKFSKYFFFCP